MRCPSCRTNLAEFDTRCGECGYSMAGVDDAEVEPTRSDGQPADVVLGVKLLAGSVGFSLFALVGNLLGRGFGTGIHARAMFASLVMLGLSGVFVGLIWMGIGWARNIYLFLIACQAANLVWGLMFAAAFVGRVRDCRCSFQAQSG